MLAERMMKEGGDDARGAHRVRVSTGDGPAGRVARRSEVLHGSFRYHLDRYQTDRDAALKLLSEGEHPRDETLDVRELAAYTAVASLILNLDETVTKE